MHFVPLINQPEVISALYPKQLPYLAYTIQLHAILHQLPDWRDTFKLTDLQLQLLLHLLTNQYPVF